MVLNACWTVAPQVEQAVIAHDHGVVGTEVAHQRLALGEVDRRTLVIVIADVAMKADRGLRHRQEPAGHGGDRHARAGVGVQDALDLGAGLVDRAVDHVAGCVDPVIGVRLPDDVAFEVDLDEARRRDLLVEKAVEIDQQMVVAAGDARGDVVVDQIGHPVGVDQAVAGREIETGLPLLAAIPRRGRS